MTTTSEAGNIGAIVERIMVDVSTLADFARAVDGQAAAERDLALAECARLEEDLGHLLVTLGVPSDAGVRAGVDAAYRMIDDLKEARAEVAQLTVLTEKLAAALERSKATIAHLEAKEAACPPSTSNSSSSQPSAQASSPPSSPQPGPSSSPSGAANPDHDLFVITRRDGAGRRFWGSDGHGGGEYVATLERASKFAHADVAEAVKPRGSRVIALSEVPALLEQDAKPKPPRQSKPIEQAIAEAQSESTGPTPEGRRAFLEECEREGTLMPREAEELATIRGAP